MTSDEIKTGCGAPVIVRRLQVSEVLSPKSRPSGFGLRTQYFGLACLSLVTRHSSLLSDACLPQAATAEKREQRTHHARIKFESRVLDQVLASFFFGTCGAKRALCGERHVSIGDAQDSRHQRNLFTPECVRIARAVPPLVMPANKQLGRAICAGARRRLITVHRMMRQVEADCI